ncbi:hypothetical protein JAAARDRAFT_193641 [Jaapia argillacea MUCL 33604]|uniref:F-box domain-containing protein n=1 Tax=Jaapia argillacea MUCL 33604 TaxID=933084 RepID=A0A067Q6I4_9AGAM|nr:hypothetical protein JAAARDRAFT_193641 [Jaapia argillacea MUCL 33604]
MAGGSPLLEILSIRQSHPPRELPRTRLRDIKIFIAPRLTSLSLYRFWHPSQLPFPWRQLTRLWLGDAVSEGLPGAYAFQTCFDVLRQCVELTHCWITCPYPQPHLASVEYAPIVLPKLYFLSVTMTSDDILFFGRLKAPSLKELAFVARGLDSIQALGNWINSSSYRLNVLTADIQKEWIEILPCLSTITDIRLTITIPIPSGNRKLLAALRPNSGSLDASPMARLQILTIFIKCRRMTGDAAS